ncbi:serine hydrolase domain-containing protein [Nocardia salmonicida]|uniref:serine hydrolase domain-containing protein n=1 Tax=Nocardia salmonicida TaxID=53431 RepID=UPI00344A3876
MPETSFGSSDSARDRDSIGGTAEPGYHEAIARFQRLFGGHRGGGALAVYHRGRKVVDVWTGTADAAATQPWAANTAALSYSTSKGITSAVVHRLADRGLIDYRAPVAEYWPEFGVKGKARITVAEAFSHRAGLSRLGMFAHTVDDLSDHRLMEARLAASAPDRFRGIPAYHAISYGTLMSGLARGVTGQDMSQLYRTELAAPLGTDGLLLGAPTANGPVRLADTHGSSVPLGLRHADTLLRRTAGSHAPGTGFVRAIYTDGIGRFNSGPDPVILRGEMPGANGVFTARSIAAVYNMIAVENPLLSRKTVRELAKVQSVFPDRNLLLPLAWRMGFHSVPVPGAPRAFGHIGFAGSGGWVDPATELAVGFVHNWAPEVAKLAKDQFVLLGLLPSIVRAAAGQTHGRGELRRAS